jgi:hypothetical protein
MRGFHKLQKSYAENCKIEAKSQAKQRKAGITDL